jgi:hypothetical protein
MSDKAKYAYLAGIIDGEGCITIGAGKKETCINYNAILCVQNTSRKLIDWIQSHFGGQIYLSKKETDKTKAAWMWRFTKKKDIELILLAILPYLVVKKEQAKILLNYVRLDRSMNSEVRRLAYEQLRALNARGKSVTTNTQEAEEFFAKIESELIGDNESDPVVTLES